MPKYDEQDIHSALLDSVNKALAHDPVASYAFSALMWLVEDAANNRDFERVTKIINDSISVGYLHTLDYMIGLHRFKETLASEYGSQSGALRLEYDGLGLGKE